MLNPIIIQQSLKCRIKLNHKQSTFSTKLIIIFLFIEYFIINPRCLCEIWRSTAQNLNLRFDLNREGEGRCTYRLGGFGGVGRHGNAHIVFGKLVTDEHLWPRVAERLHDRGAAVPHSLAEPTARVDGAIQAHRGKERAEEDLCARVALLVHQRNPAAGLLLHLPHSFVFQ